MIYFISRVKLSGSCGNYTYQLVQHEDTLRSAHTVHLCVVYGLQNKQRLFR